MTQPHSQGEQRQAETGTLVQFETIKWKTPAGTFVWQARADGGPWAYSHASEQDAMLKAVTPTDGAK